MGGEIYSVMDFEIHHVVGNGETYQVVVDDETY